MAVMRILLPRSALKRRLHGRWQTLSSEPRKSQTLAKSRCNERRLRAHATCIDCTVFNTPDFPACKTLIKNRNGRGISNVVGVRFIVASGLYVFFRKKIKDGAG